MNPELVPLLEQLKEYRLEKAAVEEDIASTQEQVLPLLKADDPEDKGVVVEAWGERFEAHYQQNSTPEHWDLENLIPWLMKKGLWKRVCTEILDQVKLEAEIRAGKISHKELQQFKMVGNAPRPFVRFDKKKRVIKVKRRKR
ncbi:hypothetical protein [Streptomyces sp. NPDC006477]|uniref:hypothetical protein n=1 Tax=Streptomyces sp. NPDC006477 TaxID=3364747 RepID=UPI0036BD97C1